MLDVRLLAIMDPRAAGGPALDRARAAEAGGATALQVRMKDSGAGALARWVERLVAALTIPVYVNDRADVAWAAGAAGVHVGADDLPTGTIARYAPPGFRIGVSVGSRAESERAVRGPADYWSIGSVFATGTKPDAGPPIGVAGFRVLARTAPADMPVIAIGGITAARVGEIREAGAAGIAAVSAIFGAADAERAARVLRDAVDAARP